MRVMIAVIVLMVGSVLSLTMLPAADTQTASGARLEATPQQPMVK